MRRTLVVAVAMLGLALTACLPTEPVMTITAKPVKACRNNAISGVVTPAEAIEKVVLQRTVNGKWQDWNWYYGSDVYPRIITARVYQDDGTYQLEFEPEKPGGPELSGTIHFRVRSSGGTKFSKSFYVTYPGSC